MEFNLRKVLKTLLLSTSEPVSIKDIQTVISRYHEQREKEAARDAAINGEAPVATTSTLPPDELPLGDPERQRIIRDIIDQVPTLLTATQIRETVDALNAEMAEADDITRILQGADGFRLVVAPGYADWVRLLRNEPKPRRLSVAQLETLSIIAYRQPVTRSELESLRGVSADSALAHLLDLELILVTGRADLPGRPIQYGTTAKFLDFCGIKTISELPASDVLTPKQINDWIARATAVKPEDTDMGLPAEQPDLMELQSPPENPTPANSETPAPQESSDTDRTPQTNFPA